MINKSNLFDQNLIPIQTSGSSICIFSHQNELYSQHFLLPRIAASDVSYRGLLELVGKDTIDEFRNGKFPRLKPGVAGVGFCSEGAPGVREPGGWWAGAKGVNRGSRWLVSEDEINSAVGFIAPCRKRAVEKGQM